MIDLGKWPSLRVVGERVTMDQAGDILLCTMPWFVSHPSDKGWELEARQIGAEFGMPFQPPYVHGGDHSAWFKETWQAFRPKFDEWRRQHGVLDVMSEDGPCNNLITTSYRAWCNWDGLVAGSFNIGKWPDPDDTAEFFTQVAARFPFLTLTADLISEHPDQRGGVADESSYDRAYRIKVHRGEVDVHEGYVEALRLPEEFFEWQYRADRFEEQGVTADRLRGAFAHLVS